MPDASPIEDMLDWSQSFNPQGGATLAVGRRMNITDDAGKARGILLEVTEIILGNAPDQHIVKVKEI